jgi:hypothetical protein
MTTQLIYNFESEFEMQEWLALRKDGDEARVVLEELRRWMRTTDDHVEPKPSFHEIYDEFDRIMRKETR